jgi:RimJ/RimL family protein N-acetyltransferase
MVPSADWKTVVVRCHSHQPDWMLDSTLEFLASFVDRSYYAQPILSASTKLGNAAYILLHPGALGTVGGVFVKDWESNLHLGDAAELLKSVVAQAKASVEIVQAIQHHGSETVDREKGMRALYTAAGFQNCATLQSLRLNLSDANPCSSMAELEFVDTDSVSEEELIAVVESTYRNSLDVPELNDLRSTRQTLIGYKSIPSSQQAWWVIRFSGTWCGCLFLTQHNEELVELVYVGLSPDFRGRGLSKQAIRHAHRWANEQGAREIVAAVDQRNHPAMRLYQSSGYRIAGTSEAWFQVETRTLSKQ